MSLPRKAFLSTLCSSGSRKNKPFQYVRTVFRPRFVTEAQKSIRDYLHQTTSLPFLYAEQIAINSPFCLSKFLRNVRFSAATLASQINKAVRYEPINEFEFFLESIGVHREHLSRFSPPKTFFFSEDRTSLDAASELFRLGFPWNKLGKLYVEDASIFRKSPPDLDRRLCELRERFGSESCLFVVGVCLAFPRLLSAAGEDHDDEELFRTLKWVFVELGLESGSVDANVDVWYEACCKVRLFLDSGCERGKIEDLLREKKADFFRCSMEVLSRKFDFFAKFGASDLEVATFLLRNLEISSVDLETPAVSILGFLKHLGLGSDEVRRVAEKYPYVLGRNQMANLPSAMKALDLHTSCFDKIKSSKGRLLTEYSIGSPEEGSDPRFEAARERIESSGCVHHVRKKLEFLKSIGFGENDATVRTLKNLQGKGVELQEKFHFLVGLGIKHSDVCYMLRRSPKMLAQSREKLGRKSEYCLGEMGCSVDFLVNYPDFYTLDLDFRLKPRHMFYLWLQAGGWRPRYSIAGMLQITEKRFARRVYGIHPAALKHYLERFLKPVREEPRFRWVGNASNQRCEFLDRLNNSRTRRELR